MTRFRTIIPRLPRILLGSLAVLVMLMLFSLAYNWEPDGQQSIQARRAGAQLRFSVDRTVAIWPLNCVRATWSAEPVTQVLLNDEVTNTTGSTVLCGADRVVFHVTFSNNTQHDYILGRDFLSMPYVVGLLILAIIISPMLAFLRRRRTPVLAWILAGFALSYLLFFIIPTFLTVGTMPFPQYVPSTSTIGTDARGYLGFVRMWLAGSGSPYPPLTSAVLNVYTPLENVLFAPLLLVSQTTAYWVISLTTLVCFGASTLVFPRVLSPGRQVTTVLGLVVVTGIISYGLQYELERGQFNIIAMSLCFAAIYLYHRQPRLRLLAYALFIISVQLKLYPLIFIVLLVDDWSAWKRNIGTFAAIAAANVALLFVLGPGIFMDYFHSVTFRAANINPWVGNESMTSFAAMLPGFGLIPPGASKLVAPLLLIIFAVCFGLVLWQAIRRNSGRLDPFLLLACAIGALIIPSVSNDYKLPLLAPIVASLFESYSTAPDVETPGWFWQRGLIFVIALFYSATLFSYVTRSGIFEFSLVSLLIILIASTMLAVLARPEPAHGLAHDPGGA